MMRSGFPLFFLILVSGLSLLVPQHAYADAASDIQAQIDSNKQQLNTLEGEIAIFQQQLDTLGKTKNTLSRPSAPLL